MKMIKCMSCGGKFEPVNEEVIICDICKYGYLKNSKERSNEFPETNE